MRVEKERILPYTPEQLYALVADVARYPEFLPWCLSSAVYPVDATHARARLTIGFRLLRENFTSEVFYEPTSSVRMTSVDGPFHKLDGAWRFFSEGEGKCLIRFVIECSFRSFFVEKTLGAVFTEAQKKLIDRFEARARDLYASSPGL